MVTCLDAQNATKPSRLSLVLLAVSATRQPRTPTTMRLRVTVRRHGLPETPILWSIDTNASPTVYQLLEQINEVIPIETDGQWGLEDYAVELKGANGINYECLHFQPVDSVLKEEDEVMFVRLTYVYFVKCIIETDLT